MATFLWCLLGIVLAILIIWLIFRWRRRAAGTLSTTQTQAPRQAPGDGAGSSEPQTVVPEAAATPEIIVPEVELDQLPTEHDSRAEELAAPRTEHSDDQQLAAASTATATLERTTAPAETAPVTVTAPAAEAPDLRAAASALGRKVALDDLTVVDGIGPKISELIHQSGVHTWRALSTTPVPTLVEILVAAGPRFGMHNPGTWPRQAGLLADGQWEQFKQWTAELDGGKERN